MISKTTQLFIKGVVSPSSVVLKQSVEKFSVALIYF